MTAATPSTNARESIQRVVRDLEKVGLQNRGTVLGGLLENAIYCIRTIDKELVQEREKNQWLTLILRKLIDL